MTLLNTEFDVQQRFSAWWAARGKAKRALSPQAAFMAGYLAAHEAQTAAILAQHADEGGT